MQDIEPFLGPSRVDSRKGLYIPPLTSMGAELAAHIEVGRMPLRIAQNILCIATFRTHP